MTGSSPGSDRRSDTAANLPEWQTCPKCIGQGHVNKPPYIAGDQPSWVSGNTGGYKCPVCGGSGMVERPSHA